MFGRWTNWATATAVMVGSFATPSESEAFFCWFRRCQQPAAAPTTAYCNPAPAPTTAYCNPCQQQACTTTRYVPTTAYRRECVSVPVTNYQPVTACDPCGRPVTTMKPITQMVSRVELRPYTTYRAVTTTVPVTAAYPALAVQPIANPIYTVGFQEVPPTVQANYAPAAPIYSQPTYTQPTTTYYAPPTTTYRAPTGCSSCGGAPAMLPPTGVPASPMPGATPQPSLITPAPGATIISPAPGTTVVTPGYSAPAYSAPVSPPATYSAPAAPTFTTPATPVSPSTTYRPTDSAAVTPSYPSTGSPTPAEPSTTHLPTYRNEGKVISQPAIETPRTTWSGGHNRFASQESPRAVAPIAPNGVKPLDDGGWRSVGSR